MKELTPWSEKKARNPMTVELMLKRKKDEAKRRMMN